MLDGIAAWLIGAGVVLVVIGLILKTGWFSWFGTLPGDIHIKRDGYQVFFPLASMIVISLLLSGLTALLRRFF
jgi:hypothetical protein